jgi:hypothetical protein
MYHASEWAVARARQEKRPLARERGLAEKEDRVREGTRATHTRTPTRACKPTFWVSGRVAVAVGACCRHPITIQQQPHTQGHTRTQTPAGCNHARAHTQCTRTMAMSRHACAQVATALLGCVIRLHMMDTAFGLYTILAVNRLHCTQQGHHQGKRDVCTASGRADGVCKMRDLAWRAVCCRQQRKGVWGPVGHAPAAAPPVQTVFVGRSPHPRPCLHTASQEQQT